MVLLFILAVQRSPRGEVLNAMAGKIPKRSCIIRMFLKSQSNQMEILKFILFVPLDHRCQTQGPRAKSGQPRHFIWPLTAWKTWWSPLYPVLLFWRFQIKWICVLILEKCSCVQYVYSQINMKQMFGSSLYSASVTTGPLRGSHDTYVAHGENEFDTPAFEAFPG